MTILTSGQNTAMISVGPFQLRIMGTPSHPHAHTHRHPIEQKGNYRQKQSTSIQLCSVTLHRYATRRDGSAVGIVTLTYYSTRKCRFVYMYFHTSYNLYPVGFCAVLESSLEVNVKCQLLFFVPGSRVNCQLLIFILIPIILWFPSWAF